MAKSKKVSNEAKRKVPFNVFRKGVVALAAAGIMVATPLMLTGCAGEKGETGPAGSTWYSGTQYSADQGKVGDFFYDTDDCNIYQKTNNGWTLISNIKGDTGVAKEVQIQATADYIQWRYEGESNWHNLVSLSALKGVKGDDGEDAVAPTVTIENGVWVINGVPTEHTAVATDGDDGNTPYIQGGYWYIDGANLNIKAEGVDGKSAYEIAYELDGTIGSETEWIASLQGQNGREVVLNVSGTHIQWKYEDEQSWTDLISLESLKGLKGDTGATGKSAYEIAQDEGFEGTEVEWLESLKGEKGDTGNGITNMEIVYEYDENGQLWAVFTITYSEGEPQVVRSAVPKRLMSINSICIGEHYSILDKYVKLENAEDTPTMYLNVRFDDDSQGNILLTQDMFTDNQEQGLVIPDFTEVGVYNYEIKYMGKTLNGQIEIVDLANYITPVSNVSLQNSAVTTTSKVSDLIVNIYYENGESVYAPLSTVAESYYSYATDQTTSELDLSIVSSYQITLKSEFAFKYNPEDEEYATLHLSVYDENCTISFINVDEIELTLGDADFEEQLKATTFEGYLHKEKDGQYNIHGTVEDLTYDLSNFNINRVGVQYIPFTYQLEGETGCYSDYFMVSVVADLSEAQAIGTYTVNQEDTNMMMFMMSQGDTITLYDNGVAEIVNNMDGAYTTQATYDKTLIESNVLKIFDTNMNDYAYYAIDAETNTIGFYTAEGEPTDYTCSIEIMGETFSATISIYGTEGTCKGKVSILMPKEVTGAPEDMFMPYAFVDCVWEDEDTVSGIGRIFNVLENNVLEEVK